MKRFLAAVAAVLLAVAAHAQVGVTVGLTSASSDVKSVLTTVKSLNQYHLGLTCKIPVGLGFALQPSLLYDVKGSSLEDATSGNVSFDTRTGYLELPVQLQWGLDLPVLGRLYALGEPYVAYAVDMRTCSSAVANGDWQKVTSWDGINRLQYGLGLGVGLELFKHLQLTGRYYWDMGPLFNGDGSLTDITLKGIAKYITDGKNKGIKLSVSYLF